LALLTGAGVSSPAAADPPTKQQCASADEAAQPLRRTSKLRDAATQLRICTSSACPGPVRDDCAQRLDEVTKAIPTVVFVVRTADAHDLSAVRVSMDGAPLAEHLDGSALEVDPGEHTFSFEGEGLAPFQKQLLLHEGDKGVRVPIVLGPTTPGPAPLPAVPVPPPPASVASMADGGSSPTAAYVVLGIGAAGLVATVVTGAIALKDKSSLDSACGAHKSTCPGSSQADIDSMHTTSLISDVSLGVGVVGLGVGAALWLLGRPHAATTGALRAPTQAHVEPWLGPRGAGLMGTFE